MANFFSRHFTPIMAVFTFCLGLGIEAMFGYLGPSLGPKIAVILSLFCIVAIVALYLFVKHPLRKKLKWVGTVAIAIIVIGFYFLVTPKLISRKIPDANKVHLGIYFAYEWNHPKANIKDESTWWQIIIDESLSAKYESGEKGFYFGMENDNPWVPLLRSKLIINFPSGLEVVDKEKGWQERDTDKTYVREFSIINTNDHEHGRLLKVRFPSPGTYEIKYKIKALAMKDIENSIKVVLEP